NKGGAMKDGSRQRRELWAAAGVAADELSSTVLVHRLQLPGPLGDLTAAGEPIVLTLRQVRRLEVPVPRAPVFVCENPSVVDAAARELRDASAPIVCILGQPSLAAELLLQKLSPTGIRYHGDFDGGGVCIANHLYERFGFEAWRCGAIDLALARGVPGSALKGSPVDARWDEHLRPELERRAVRLEEEQVMSQLIADLAVG
ncbi:MAG: DUF2399 domain-containing protein, partial [Lacisediminihabitans sp.]